MQHRNSTASTVGHAEGRALSASTLYNCRASKDAPEDRMTVWLAIQVGENDAFLNMPNPTGQGFAEVRGTT